MTRFMCARGGGGRSNLQFTPGEGMLQASLLLLLLFHAQEGEFLKLSHYKRTINGNHTTLGYKSSSSFSSVTLIFSMALFTRLASEAEGFKSKAVQKCCMARSSWPARRYSFPICKCTVASLGATSCKHVGKVKLVHE
jgi:hypothetical protein